MAEARRAEDTGNSRPRQGDKAPRVVVQLLDLSEIHERWGYTENRIYAAVARGELHAYGRPGRQKYYSERELIAIFGEPNGSGPNSNSVRRTDKGGNQERFDFERVLRPAA